MRWRMVWAVFVLAGLSGCAGSRKEFQPVGGHAPTPVGYKSALYMIRTGSSDWGAVNVAVGTDGIRQKGKDAPEAALADSNLIQLRFMVANNSTTTVRLDGERTRLDLLVGAEATRDDLERVPNGSDLNVAPHSDQETTLYYRLPDQTALKDITAFVLRWVITSNGLDYSDTTFFVRDTDDERHYYPAPYGGYYTGLASGYHDPWYGGRSRSRIGIGFGLGFWD